MQIQTKHILIHTLCWLIYLSTLILGSNSLNSFFWGTFLSNNLPIILLFYFTIFYVFPKHLSKKQYFPLIVWLVVSNVLVILLRFVLLLLITGGTLADLLDAWLSPIILSILRINILFTGISLAYWYWKRSIVFERQQQQLKREISEARLKGLKNQINPHFLYNTLSFLYTKALPLSKDLSEAIGKLAEMMRYSLGDIADDEKVALDKEMKHLENFIQIHQLRFNHGLHINFSVEGEIFSYKIMPLLLITFVENAFKHGKINDATDPLLINIKINNGQLYFKIRNKKAFGIKEKSSGIGLTNVKNRLALAYPNEHSLDITDSGDHYCADLTINLKA
jgi:two-component system LytT family sensor kinase